MIAPIEVFEYVIAAAAGLSVAVILLRAAFELCNIVAWLLAKWKIT